jgi:hypothetical protein
MKCGSIRCRMFLLGGSVLLCGLVVQQRDILDGRRLLH